MQFSKCTNDIKNTWKLINSLIGKAKFSSCKSLNVNNTVFDNPKNIANCFNDYFASASIKLIEKLPPKESHFSDNIKFSSPNSLFVWPTCPQEISNILKTFKSKYSAGPDNIPMKVLKSSPDNILIALSHIFNNSLVQGKFINCFKLATVCPVFKKGDKCDVNNYRPVSLLFNISKVLEKIM